MILLLDAANTLIHKPSFAQKFLSVLESHSIAVDPERFAYHHKLLSEAIEFPDKTSKSFYSEFNSMLLYSLGIIPESELLDEIFRTCSYLPWEPFDDVTELVNWQGQISVLSNFHSGLTEILNNCVPSVFSSMIISEKSSYRKPDTRFFQEAIDHLGCPPKDIIYIGDSPKLDLHPALLVGMNTWLIDRTNFYPASDRRISSFADILSLAGR
jgi:FMN phosphatase YigB (HAD superfamily)